MTLRLSAVLQFAVLSGTGLFIDFGAFFVLLHLGFTPASSNFVSATLAVTFVYFSSVSRVFSYSGRFQLPLFCAYLAYQAIAVSLASVAVGALAPILHSAGWAKIALLPVTFSMNFLFMMFLTRDRTRPQ